MNIINNVDGSILLMSLLFMISTFLLILRVQEVVKLKEEIKILNCINKLKR